MTFDDDFARVNFSLYHLSCLFGALRTLGDDSAFGASVKAGIDALGRQETSAGSSPTPPRELPKRRSPRDFTVPQ